MESIYPSRRSTRLPGFDYGQDAAYFISLVAEHRRPLFGDLVNATVRLSPAGDIVKQEWLQTPLVRPGLLLDEWIIMPDHFQAIVRVDSRQHSGNVGAHRSAPAGGFQRGPRTLGSLIGQFKSVTTTRINQIRGTLGDRVWQRGFYDRIIRNEVELDKTRRYIRNNPRNAEKHP